VRLFVAAPRKGPERQPFAISAQVAGTDEKGDSDATQFERPENEEDDE